MQHTFPLHLEMLSYRILQSQFKYLLNFFSSQQCGEIAELYSEYAVVITLLFSFSVWKSGMSKPY